MTNRQLTADEIKAVQDWMGGAPMQMRDNDSNRWIDMASLTEVIQACGYYRLAPDQHYYRSPPKDRVVYTGYGMLHTENRENPTYPSSTRPLIESFIKNPDDCDRGMIKVTFDGETGLLKDVSIVKGLNNG